MHLIVDYHLYITSHFTDMILYRVKFPSPETVSLISQQSDINMEYTENLISPICFSALRDLYLIGANTNSVSIICISSQSE